MGQGGRRRARCARPRIAAHRPPHRLLRAQVSADACAVDDPASVVAPAGGRRCLDDFYAQQLAAAESVAVGLELFRQIGERSQLDVSPATECSYAPQC